MFMGAEAEAAAIREAFEQSGELAAAVEIQRLFPDISDMEIALCCARAIAIWSLRALPPSAKATRARRGKDRSGK
ncbi:hypothetical protein [Rhodovastum atsumiense]|uniref:Uncharacterized protein n=1 Tax=Rhodovastum atsumiense TaxID=504468 RepID=A0A5M6ITI6_9PROT|nr:hypothetical protein [Rhodovastum atsumiense]KAA5611624.1 hypothetical protein F1189_13775 [Rhodovastum atsumiense]